MHQLIITSNVPRQNTIKAYCRKRLSKSLSDKNINAVFCRITNQFSIYAVELIVELGNGEVVEMKGRHFFVNKAFDLSLYYLSKKMTEFGLITAADSMDFMPKTA